MAPFVFGIHVKSEREFGSKLTSSLKLKMAKSRIGPFALEAPLSKAKPSGQVFRGIHLEQKKLAALRVFPVPMGMTPESRQAYASQLEELKQLRHPGVVRCFGGGFDTRSAFLAYELVDGESLADLLARRGRLPWETALDLGLQLASALEYTHEMGWVHGRLEPSKILVSNDQQAKIIDFRRSEIASMLSGPKTLALLSCSAPEVLQNGVADEKSDLYSLGAILFQMLTGKPPYAAASLEELQQLVLAQDVPRVGAEVLDCPVWFNAIVEQLLAKDPKQRPYSTTALQLALKEAQKRQNEGVGVLQHATAGFSPLQMKVDRAEAEKVLGIKKPKKRKKASDSSFFENPWVLLVAFVLAVGGAVWFMLPLSEDALRSESEELLASEEWIDWNDARDTYLRGILERFPEGENAEWAQEKIDWVDAREAERRMDRDERLGRTDDWSQAQVQYAEARKYERFGDLKTAFDKFRAIVGLFRNQESDAAIVFLARESIARIREKGIEGNVLVGFLESRLSEADKAYDRAQISEAKRIWESIIELYEDNQEAQPLVARAQERLDELAAR